MSVIGQEAGIKHGTWAGYKQHLYRQVDVCDDCADAARAQNHKPTGGEQAPAKPRFKNDAQRAWHGSPQRMWDGPSVSRDIRAEATPLPTGTIPGRELKVGDVIVFCGRHYPVDRIEPYTGSLRAELGEGTRVAYSGEWGMTIGPDRAIRVAACEARHAS